MGGEDGLSIDWIEADATEERARLLIFTTGEHGIEGYVGSAMLQVFLEEYLGRLDPRDTGLLIVHSINPWGMRHRRRANGANLDLNRTFLARAEGFDPAFNPDCESLSALLHPEGPIRSLALARLAFALRLLRSLLAPGMAITRRAALLGQYRFPQGLHYGGRGWPDETLTLMDLYRSSIAMYDRVLHLDMHTGQGPRYQMSLVNSWMEERDSRDLERAFDYPLVVKSNPEEFYSVQGDMIDFVYSLFKEEFPLKRFYSTSFEFGTYGDSILADTNALCAMVMENRLHWYGAARARDRERVERDFCELFFPSEGRWREKAVSDARQAFEGILAAEGFLKP